MKTLATSRTAEILLLVCCGCMTGCVDIGQFDKEGGYTIMLASFTDPPKMAPQDRAWHVEQAKLYKARTEAHTHWPNLYIINEDNTSTLYWGRYKSIEAAGPSLRQAKAYRTEIGEPVFAQAVIVPVPGKGREGPTEWNIENAPGEWTILVSVYFDEPDARNENNQPAPYYGHRDRRAIEVCKDLRKKGYEAYYYYGKYRSAVVIGSFPAGSVVSDKFIDPNTGETVMPGRIENDDMKKIIGDFPYLIVNELGRQTKMRNMTTNQDEYVMEKTFAVRIRDFRDKDAGSFNNFSQPQPR